MIAAHVPNLFDRSRFSGRVKFVDTPEEARAIAPELLIIDIDRCEDVAGFCIDGPRVVGFGPHVEQASHGQALGAGYDEVLPRSLFFRRLASLLDSADSEP